MRVVLSDLAEADLESIAVWIARDSPTRARTFVRELRHLCESFSVHPKRAPVARIVDGRELRRAVHGSYLVYIEVDDRRDEVTVVRVVHGARDQDVIFPHERS